MQFAANSQAMMYDIPTDSVLQTLLLCWDDSLFRGPGSTVSNHLRWRGHLVTPPSASLEEKWQGKALGLITGTQKVGGEGWSRKGHYHEPKLQCTAMPTSACDPPAPSSLGISVPICPGLRYKTAQAAMRFLSL